MARNVQVRSQVRQATRQYADEIGTATYKGRPDLETAKKPMKFSFGQLLLFWGVTILMMLAVFTFGYSAGRRSGAETVLDDLAGRTFPGKIRAPKSTYAKTVTLGDAEGAPAEVEERKIISPTETIDFASKDSLPIKAAKEVVENVPAVDEPKVIEPKVIESKKGNSKPEKDRFVEIYRGRELFPPPKKLVVPVAAEPDPVVVDDEISAKEEAQVKEASTEALMPVAGWYIQIAAAPSEDEAVKLYSTIESAGLPASLEPATIRNKSFYRVLVGPFESRSEALQQRSNAKTAAKVSSEPFIREVRK